MIRRLFSRLRARLTPDHAATLIKRQIKDAQRRHAPTAHLRASLRDLRHAGLRLTR